MRYGRSVSVYHPGKLPDGVTIRDMITLEAVVAQSMAWETIVNGRNITGENIYALVHDYFNDLTSIQVAELANSIQRAAWEHARPVIDYFHNQRTLVEGLGDAGKVTDRRLGSLDKEVRDLKGEVNSLKRNFNPR